MKQHKLFILAAAIVLPAFGCAKGDSSVICKPSNSLHLPSSQCVSVSPAPTEEVEAEPVAQAKPEHNKVRFTNERIEILEKVQFAQGSADILDASYELLNEVSAVMQEHPEVTQLRIEGHTSSEGGDEMNNKLSKARAESVMTYLSTHDIDAGRMHAEGYGSSQPISDNESDEGREKNRRVEFIIEKLAGSDISTELQTEEVSE